MERELSRRGFLRNSIALSLMAPRLLIDFFDRGNAKIVFDIAGYNLPLPIAPEKQAMAVREFRMLRGHSAVVVNPPLSLVDEFRKINKQIIVRPYFEHNNYNPRAMNEYLNCPPGTVWLPFVEPNIIEDLSVRDEASGECIPKIVGKIEHDPEEIINYHLVPFAKAILARPGGDQDIILIPPTSQWASEDEFDYPEVMYKVVSKSSIPLKNLSLSVHDYQRRYSDGLEGWSRLKKLVEISTETFGKLLPMFVTEAGPYQDENSIFTESEKAEVTEKALVREINVALLQEALVSYNLWNQGFKRYAQPIMKDPTGCHSRVVNWFEKAAIIKENGPTETFHRIRDLAKRRDKELGVSLQAT